MPDGTDETEDDPRSQNATSFTLLGVGNGFDGCLPNRDVSEYDHVEPLSLGQAMSLYWNLFSGTSSFSSGISEKQVVDGTIEIDYTFNKNLIRESGTQDVSPEPIKRICGGPSTNPIRYEETMTEAELEETGGAGCSGVSALNPVIILRMYDGDTSDASKFIGYGIESLYSAVALSSHLDNSLSVSASISIGSFLDGDTESGSDDVGSNTLFYNRKASIVQIGGLPFRAYSQAFCNGSPEISPTIEVNKLDASVSATYTITSETPSGGQRSNTRSSSAEVNAPTIKFFSYNPL